MLQQSEAAGQTTELIEQKLQQQRLFDRYKEQEKKYTGLQHGLLEIYGKLQEWLSSPQRAGAGDTEYVFSLEKMLEAMPGYWKP